MGRSSSRLARRVPLGRARARRRARRAPRRRSAGGPASSLGALAAPRDRGRARADPRGRALRGRLVRDGRRSVASRSSTTGTLTDDGAGDVKTQVDRESPRPLAGRAAEGLGSQRDGRRSRRARSSSRRASTARSRSRAGSGSSRPSSCSPSSAARSLTYQNVADALMTFARVTLQPVYLAPIEEALERSPAGHASRAPQHERARAARHGGSAGDAYAAGLGAGFVTPEQIDRWEGWHRASAPPARSRAPLGRRRRRRP